MSSRRGWAAAAVVMGVVSALGSGIALPSRGVAATLRLINRDGPSEGFNDPTPAEPVGGNAGTTIGEQRLIAFQRAVDLWAVRIDSPVEIRISATFDPLQCNSSEVTLGMAGPVSVFRDFASAPLPNTYYPSALADRLAGTDLGPDEDDIEAMFNSRFGTTCAFPAGWYYGLDANPPGDDSDLVTVVLHELGHGLGFLSLIDVRNGSRFDGRNDVFMTLLLDDRSGLILPDMSNAQRRAAIVSETHLKWFGEAVRDASSRVDAGADASGRVEMYAPPDPVEGSSLSHWSEALFPNELMEPFFTHAIHDVGLSAEALIDMGWTPIAICQSDCDGDGVVTINELISAVRIALGEQPVANCASVDADDSGSVEVNELVGAVNRALAGCAV